MHGESIGRQRARLMAALIGTAAIALGLPGAPSAGAVGSGGIAITSRDGGTRVGAIVLIPSDRLATGANSRVLAAGNSEFTSLQWTPDGKTLVYVQSSDPTKVNERYDLYAVDVASLRHRLIAANVYGAHTAALSPDGKTVAYSLERSNGAVGVYLVGVDGRSRRHLSDGVDSTWSPDSKRLAIVSARGVVIVEADGRGAHPLGKPSAVWSIAWAPSGNSLLEEIVDPYKLTDTIELVGLNGDVLHKLTSTAWIGTGTWSPQGTQVAFIESRSGKRYAVVVNADGSSRHTIDSTGSESMLTSLAWSPDGGSVVTVNEDRARVVRADGTRPHVVLYASEAILDDPAWQPRP